MILASIFFADLRAGPFSAHPLQGFARDQEGSTGVGGEHRIPLAQGEALEIRGGVVGGVVDQDVDAAEFASGLFHHGLDAGFVGDVAMQGEGAHAQAGEVDDGMLCVAGGSAKSDGDIGAGLGQSEGGGASETPGAAGDEAGFAEQGPGIECNHFRILLLNVYS